MYFSFLLLCAANWIYGHVCRLQLDEIRTLASRIDDKLAQPASDDIPKPSEPEDNAGMVHIDDLRRRLVEMFLPRVTKIDVPTTQNTNFE